MDEFETAKPGTATLDHLCRVRLYLGATTLADICDDNGKVILLWTLTGCTRGSPDSPWPNQEKLSKYSWRIWRQYLRTFFATKIPSNSCLDTDWPLDGKLGLWVVPRPLMFRYAYIYHDSNTLFVRSTNGHYTQHKQLEGHMSTYIPTTTQITEPPITATFIPI
eukprot:956080-Ditylum_brightwellii.AAC.1